MFQKFTVFKIAAGLPASADTLANYLQHSEFAPTAATQEKAAGFVPPREAHGAFVEAIGGHWIACLAIETRSVPGDAVKKHAQAAADQIEATTGRKPGRKEMRELREDALLALLPQAFPKQVRVPIWFDPKAQTLVVGATTDSKTDEVVTALVRSVPDLAVHLLQTKLTPVTAMAMWLASDENAEMLRDLNAMTIGRECELRSADEEKSVVKFTRHTISTAEVRRHVAEGKLPKRLALEWAGRVAFVLDDCMRAHKVNMLEGVFDGRDGDDVDQFDADVAIYTGELSALIANLVEALGGEFEPSAALPAGGAA